MTRPARPLDPALEAARLQADQALRLTNASLGALRLLTRGASNWNELLAIGTTSQQRLVELQLGWTRDWLELLRHASQGAASLSKLNERVIQAAQLVSEQYVATLNLLESIEADSLNWISEQSPPPTQAPT